MDILYILGNGFDKAQGLATSYVDFYGDWLKRKPESELEQKVISVIGSDYATWADLEEGLGKYSASWPDDYAFLEVLNLFNRRLKEYLISQNDRLEELALSRSTLIRDLCQPELHLEPSGRAIYEKYVYGENRTLVNIDVVSLNYTNTFERAIAGVKPIEEIQRVHQNQYYYRGILHLHGILDEMILVGVNDESQIDNESFRSSAFLRNSFIKPEINDGCMNTRNADFSRRIEAANVIVLFGVSVGVTDNVWWHAIGERMSGTSSPLLLYFPFDPSKDTVATPNYKRLWSDHYIAFLRERMQINKSIEALRGRIRVGINKDFLKLSV